MPRLIRLAAAQLGPTQRADTRPQTLARLISLLEKAAAEKATFVVFPELAFTTFFPRWLMDDAALEAFCERSLPGPATQALFDRARELRVGFHVGYAELTPEGKRYNAAVIVGRDGRLLSKYRKVHLPGTLEPRDGAS